MHQTSIKLVINYREAYEYLYRSVINWYDMVCLLLSNGRIQNPFSEASNRNWPDLEELLLGASLVGILLFLGSFHSFRNSLGIIKRSFCKKGEFSCKGDISI